MNIRIFFFRGGIWNTKSRKRLAFVCVYLFCVVCVQHTTGYPKDFLSLRRSNFVLEDAAKRSREIRGLVCLTIVCIVSDD